MPHTAIRLLPSFYTPGEAQPQQLSPLLSPVRVQATAHLYGIETAALQQARVLEIDCGTGNNLLPFALAYPGATVIGISLDAADCLAGQTLAQEMGAANLHLFALSLEQIDANIGEFDYILVRRLYGQLPPDAAVALLQTCESLLAPNGVACVGYETYPGAKMAEIVRDAMLMHAHSSSDPEQIAELAQAALTLFNEGMAPANPQAQMLNASAKQLAAQLRHEGVSTTLGHPGTPRYFIEFAGQVAQAGMEYVGDSDAIRDLPERWGSQVHLINTVLAMGQAGAMRLQYLDLATGRSARHSLLVSARRGVGSRHQPDTEKMADLRWSAGWRRQSWGLPDEAGRAIFVNHQGRQWHSQDIVGTAILDVLALAWPGSVSYADLERGVQRAVKHQRPVGESVTTQMRSVLLQMMLDGVVQYCLESGPYDAPAGPDSRLLPSVEYIGRSQPDIAAGAQTSGIEKTWFPFNLWHEPLANNFGADEWRLATSMGAANSLAAHITEHNSEPAFQPLAATGLTLKSAAALRADIVYKLWAMGGVVTSAAAWRECLVAILQGTGGTLPYWGMYVAAIERYALQVGEEDAASSPQTFHLTPQQKAQIQRAAQLLAQLNFAEAEVLAHQLIKRLPLLPDGYVMLARCQGQTGRYVEAFETIVKIISAHRWNIEYLVDIVVLLSAHKMQDDALRVARIALMTDTQHARMLNAVGLLCLNTGRLAEAEGYFVAAIEADPSVLTARVNHTSVLSRQGRVKDGVTAGHLALEDRTYAHTADYRTAIYHNLLFLSNYDSEQSAEEIFQTYNNFENEFCRPLYREWKRHKNNRNTRRRLRVGYVSPDFRQHAVAQFIEPVFELHDRDQFEIFAYSNVKNEDGITEKFKRLSDRWIPVSGLDDAALAERIRIDEIDVLIDLAGHTADNRLGVFARKPAPVSATWLGFGYTTGVSAIDYFIGDQQFCPPGCDTLFAEKIWRLPHCFAVYRVNWDAMREHTPWGLPSSESGYVTFTCLSRAIRINDRVVNTWARILKKVPGSRLVLNSVSYADAQVCDEFRQKFYAHGVTADRLLFGYSSPPWKTLGTTDIGLDCFPHNSGTTLMDMLCMGVPYVTLADRPSVGRMGGSFLHAVGLSELIATTEDEYVELAVALAMDSSRLEGVRANLAQQVVHSPLVDEAGFVSDLENAYQEMFAKWAVGKANDGK